MLGLKQIHHIAIIATDYAKSKSFYCGILGFTLQSEVYREARDSWKGDLALNGQYVIELFSFPFPPARPVVRRLAGFAIWPSAWTILTRPWCTSTAHGVEPARRFVSIVIPVMMNFFNDPDGLPLGAVSAVRLVSASPDG
ncbi:VOC family protein [Escherichia coli]